MSGARPVSASALMFSRIPRRASGSIQGVLCRMSDPRDVSVYSLLFNIVSALVDHPDDIIIRTTSQPGGASFTVHVHPSDRGKAIGKQGRTAQSIRTILETVGLRHERKYALQIDEPEKAIRD